MIIIIIPYNSSPKMGDRIRLLDSQISGKNAKYIDKTG
jgi:hypothetical protein